MTGQALIPTLAEHSARHSATLVEERHGDWFSFGAGKAQDILEGYQGELPIGASALGGACFSLRLPRAGGKS